MTTHQPFVLAAGPALPETTERVPATVLSRAERHPDRPAVICGDRTLSYRALALAARATAAAIEAHPAGPASRRIGVRASRSELTVAQVLGTWLSGRSAVLVNPQAPEQALAHIRSSTGLLLTADPDADALLHHPLPAGTPLPEPTPAQEAYVLHTSGSTGRPKGVSVSHPNLTASNSARLTAYQEFGTPVFLLLSPFHFDSSVAGVWGTLAAGGTLVVADEQERRDPGALLGRIARHGVTHLLTVPGFHAELLASWAQHPDAAELLATLRVLVSAGEALPQSVIEQHFALLPGVALANEYGPTECTVWSTYRIYRRPARSTIGFPIPGTELHLLDDQLRPVGPGETGQIAVSGPGVAFGYVGDRRRTAEVFVELAAPCGRVSRAYLTGDLGRWTDEEGLEFLGRVDNEVKVRGVRITIEAVEEALAAHPGVQAVAVAHDAATSTLAAFVVPLPGSAPDAASVRRTGELALGPAGIPDRVRFVTVLPRTAHDKVDRAALLADLAAEGAAAADGNGAQPDGLAGQVARVWAELLGTGVTRDCPQTFFELGGNSLTVLRLTRALGKLAGHPVGVADVYRCATLDQQVELLSRV
ncbi:hypothetical protein GCM10020229_07660 [Kitasatospora albolonga]|uniref:non-ribosomal peptide synthetase n=1 Tax=Kitasatospora albolonga TaxID=68173 RepID=UPI0031E83766